MHALWRSCKRIRTWRVSLAHVPKLPRSRTHTPLPLVLSPRTPSPPPALEHVPSSHTTLSAPPIPPTAFIPYAPFAEQALVDCQPFTLGDTAEVPRARLTTPIFGLLLIFKHFETPDLISRHLTPVTCTFRYHP
eukprot:6181015-Pleurochrysis_carterae.AAC.2